MSSNEGVRQVLRLLWGQQHPGRRGPRPTMTRERIVEAALSIADSEGLDAMSMRRVAERLGVGTASLYTYVPGKEELFALMLDVMVGKERLPDDHPGTWREKIADWARADWNDYRAHPWVIQLLSARQLAGPGSVAWMNSALSILEDTGLTEAEMLAAVTSVDAYVRGQAREAVQRASRAEGQTTDEDAQSWEDAEGEFLSEHVDWSQYPTLLRVVEAEEGTIEETFEFGLRCLLDGLEARMRQRAGNGTSSAKQPRTTRTPGS